MPYIKKEDRKQFEAALTDLSNTLHSTSTPGDLNYIFSRIANMYLSHGLKYQKINDVIGALEGCKLELYRKVVVPYEEQKIKENGNI